MFNLSELKFKVHDDMHKVIAHEVNKRNLFFYKSYHEFGGVNTKERQAFQLNLDASARMLGGFCLVDVYMGENKVFSVKCCAEILFTDDSMDFAEAKIRMEVIEPTNHIGPIKIDNHIFELTEN